MKKLSEIAEAFEGIQEIPDNQGWKDRFLSQIMNAIGFEKGWAWCMLFSQVCVELYLTQFDTSLINKYRIVFSPGAVKSFNNFKNIFPDMISDIPVKDSICIWQRYKNGSPTWMGHAGIVKDFTETYITTIDGNTNKAGSREGDGVYIKTRLLENVSDNGLRILGFIQFPKP